VRKGGQRRSTGPEILFVVVVWTSIQRSCRWHPFNIDRVRRPEKNRRNWEEMEEINLGGLVLLKSIEKGRQTPFS
jgi:hypothetical protein